MEERTFTITESELNKVYQYVISKPISEAIGAYSILLEVGKRDNVVPKQKEENTKEEVKSKDDK